METPPKVSIITVCFNAEATLERTIQSVIAQTYPNLEYVVWDGQSKDGTLALAQRYEKQITKIVSAPDKNHFDAMNKVLDHVTGDYIWYLHAGDVLFEDRTVELAMQNHQDADFIYGKAVMVTEEGDERAWHKAHPNEKKLNWKSFRNGMIICHQAMIIKRSVTVLYDLEYPLVGDLDWSIRVLKNSKKVKDTNTYLCRFLEGGISAQTRSTSLKERFRILVKHFGLASTLSEHVKIVFQALRRGRIG